MAQAAATKPSAPAATPAPGSAESSPARPSMGTTLWFFAFTAMALLFAAVLLLGLVLGSSAVEASQRGVAIAVTLAAAVLAVVALAYVYESARRYTLLESAEVAASLTATTAAERLAAAPTIEQPRLSGTGTRAPSTRRSRERQLRAIRAEVARSAPLPQAQRRPSPPAQAAPRGAVNPAPVRQVPPSPPAQRTGPVIRMPIRMPAPTPMQANRANSIALQLAASGARAQRGTGRRPPVRPPVARVVPAARPPAKVR